MENIHCMKANLCMALLHLLKWLYKNLGGNIIFLMINYLTTYINHFLLWYHLLNLTLPSFSACVIT